MNLLPVDSKSTAFLREVLGDAGAEALLKAVGRSPALASVLVPRAIIGWAISAANWGYEGPVPGQLESLVEFRKSETPGLFSGAITSQLGGTIAFTDTTLYRLAAHLAMAVGVDATPDPGLRDLDLARLGKSIDALAKAQLLGRATRAQTMSTHGPLEVIHAGVGLRPYFIRRRQDGRMIMNNVESLADAQRIADDVSGIKSPVMGAETHPLDKVALDPNLGYKISHEHVPAPPGGMAMTKVHAHSPTGEHVGTTTLVHQGGNLQPMLTAVDEGHQRRGIASAMYAHAQRQTGKTLIPSSNQTEEGAALWSGTGGKFGAPMGKVEPPGQTAKPTPQQGPQEPAPPQKQLCQQRPPAKTGDDKPVTVKAPPRTPEKVPSTAVPAPSMPSTKAPTMKVGKSEAHGQRCRLCHQTQFGPDGGFYGCVCFRAMCSDVLVKAEDDGYQLIFGDTWDEDARAALLEALKPI